MNWWGGTELDREADGEYKEGKEHRFQYPRGTRAGWGNIMAEWSYDIWTPRYVVARNWQTHWKYKKWEQQALKPNWRTGAQWETSMAWNEEGEK